MKKVNDRPVISRPDPLGLKFTDKFGLERDWSSEMPNGGGWSHMKGGEFTALFGASPAEIVGWTIKGMFSDNSKCCLTKFAKCMFLPDFSNANPENAATTSSTLFSLWKKSGWIYGPMNVPITLFLGKTAVSTVWTWYRLSGPVVSLLSKFSSAATMISYGICLKNLIKCMN